MAILIDPPRWPAHGTQFAHLACDTSLTDLHSFALTQGLSWRAFDHDHYDVPAQRVAELIAAGARPVESRHLVQSLNASGLRVRRGQRVPRRSYAIAALSRSWAQLLPQAPALGARLLERWQEPHRHYHDVGHLFQTLSALAELAPAVPQPVALAAWFHDAIYQGIPGQDEADSAILARAELSAAGLDSALIDEVSRLVLLTTDHDPAVADHDGILLVDADLSILGQVPGRYQVYLRDVRLEHPELDETRFEMARRGVVRALLSPRALFRSELGRRLWLNQARENLSGEAIHWSVVRGHHRL